ncbi:hypothetical protein [Ruegeria atlantica]|uniref:hypothetical protein n=1 Tax=Ruegeria atlantica TaxID=81569 RepID=UPI0014817348|nr:hypothetical protein [Ruegeria atlantica]
MHREVVALGRTAKEIAAEIGEMLQAEKKKRKDFKAWCQSDALSFSYRTAADYMRVAREKVQSAALFDECESIADVLAIGKTKAAPKPDTRAATLNDLRKVERLRALRDNPAATEGEKRAAQHGHAKKFAAVKGIPNPPHNYSFQGLQ